MKNRRTRFLFFLPVLFLVARESFQNADAQCVPKDGIRVAALLDEPANRALSLESMTVRDIAQRLFDATSLHLDDEGRFVDPSGAGVSLDSFSVLWIHTASTIPEASRFRSPDFLKSLQQFLDKGRGLLLTGTAVLLLEPLGYDTLQTEPLVFGNDRDQSGMQPTVPSHPIFTGLDWDRGVLWLSNVTYPCWSLFGTVKGRVLGVNPERRNAPHLEYSLEKGKLLAVPWHVGAMYDKAPRGHRHNFELLVSNMVRYLDDSLTVPASPRPKIEEEIEALDRAIRHLSESFGERYHGGEEFSNRLDAMRRNRRKSGDETTASLLDVLRREALLANPLLDFDRILLIRRGENQLGLPLNYHANTMLPKNGYDNRLVALSDWKTRDSTNATTLTVCEPENGNFLGDVDLHFEGERILFSSIDEHGHWRVFESNVDGSNLHKLPLIPDADVDCYDACYLPDDGVVFCSTACFAGVPCVNGDAATCNLYRYDRDGRIRQLTYEQDQDWCPTVLNSGRLLYLRWEYTDIPHAYSRILFHANPDGTNQTEYYGSGSYWPGSMFFAQPIPNHPTKFVAVVGGHHELPRMGDLVLFDPARGRRESDGAIQRIPGFGREVQPVMLDLPIERTWPKFLHPMPLDEHFFLVSSKPSPDKPWGIYLVDTFDNMVLIHEEPGFAMLEPIPLKKRPRPPVIPDRTDPERHDAEMFIANIYEGQGLPGVRKGTVKSLRLYSYQFSYQGMGAEPYSIGMDGPWDPRRILGTVPVYDDGSAYFTVPAYTPIAMQPLDEEGKAIQVMRSWITAMPGEVVSCIGCHEEQNSVVAPVSPKASRMQPSDIEPWYGPPRGFSFVREIQPVLDQYCTECHHEGNEQYPGIASFLDGPQMPLLEQGSYINEKSRFSRAYYELRRFVRTSTKEGTMQVPHPREYHADTTRLVQLLKQGHYGVEPDAEAWDRLVTWIDLNAPFHGNWRDIIQDDNPGLVKHQFARRHEMRRRYTGMNSLLDDDPNVESQAAILQPKDSGTIDATDKRNDTSTSEITAQARIAPFDSDTVVKIPLEDAVEIELVPIPSGESGKSYLMARTEITNRQYSVFDPKHDSRIEFGDFLHFSPGEMGWSLSHPEQPVVRVSWNDAMAFCRWLSEKTGKAITLPTEEQWEYAARAGTRSPLWYGTTETDFSPYANLSDVSNQQIDRFSWDGRAETLPAWRPAVPGVNDHSRISAAVGSYAANPWGLFDMHGNVSEWTTTPLSLEKPKRKIVKGGSWYDEPKRATITFRQDYLDEQPVYDVGFRIIVTD